MKGLFLLLAVILSANAPVLAPRGGENVAEAVQAHSFANQLTFTGGTTTVRLTNELVNAASTLGITVSPVRVAGVRGANALFPITWGTIDAGTLRGEIMHSRFLIFERGGSAVKIEGFIIDTTGQQALINGLASANGSVVGRIPLFNVDLGAAQISQTGAVLQIANVRLTLRPEAAAALNAVFSTNAFVEGFNIGTATVSGIVSQGN
jgi:hypothetical protein